jgi:hypothetical protein
VARLEAALAEAERDGEGLGCLHATSTPGDLHLPADAGEWPEWAAEVANFGTAASLSSPVGSASSPAGGRRCGAAGCAPTTPPPPPPSARRRRPDAAPHAPPQSSSSSSLFLNDTESVADVAARLPEVQAWAEVCGDVFSGALRRLADSLLLTAA